MPRILDFGGEKVEGQDLSGVMYGHTFLHEVSHGHIRPNYFKGKKVLVIGGGNVAFDAARTAKRLGGDTTMVCLECEDKSSKDGIPADWDEIRGAWEEGIRIVYSRGVRKIFARGDKVKGIECPACVSVFDETGFNPKFDVSDVIGLDGDAMIITVGQGPEKGSLREENLLDERGRLAVDPVTLQSLNKEWVFFGGDLRRIGFMVDAMKDGLVAADSIERYLRGLDMKEGRKREYEAQDLPLRRVYQSEPEIIWIPPEKRMHFELFERGFTLPEAIGEAKRCLTCGPCISCKACISTGIQESLPSVEVRRDRCSGCGVCVSVCYYNAAQLREEEGKRRSITDTFKCKSCGMCVSTCPSGARVLVGDGMTKRIEETYAAVYGAVGGEYGGV
jgi:ferredoxin